LAQAMGVNNMQPSQRRPLTFPYRDFSEYTCGLVDNTP
jgi:hypothetical protein